MTKEGKGVEPQDQGPVSYRVVGFDELDGSAAEHYRRQRRRRAARRGHRQRFATALPPGPRRARVVGDDLSALIFRQ